MAVANAKGYPFENIMPKSNLREARSKRIEEACRKFDSLRNETQSVETIRKGLEYLKGAIQKEVRGSRNAKKFGFQINEYTDKGYNGNPQSTTFTLSVTGPAEISYKSEMLERDGTAIGQVSFVTFETNSTRSYDVFGPAKKVRYAFVVSGIESAIATLKATVEAIMDYGKKKVRTVEPEFAKSD